MVTIEDLKERWFNAYPEVVGITGNKPIQCYAKKDVDECLAGIEAVPHTDNSSRTVSNLMSSGERGVDDFGFVDTENSG